MILGILASSIRRVLVQETVPWTPEYFTTAVWLDAADAETFTLTGTSIDQWSDKSGNARHATPATATKPTLIAAGTTGINLLSTVLFSSATDPLITPSFANPTGAEGLSVATVMRRISQPVNYSDPFCKGAVNAEWSLIWASNLGALPVGDRNASFWRGNGLNDTAASPAGTLADGVAYLWSGAMSDASNKQFLQGTELAGSQGATTHSFGGPSVLTIGSSPDSTYVTNRYHGEIGELVIMYADTRDVIRQQTEGYLAWKWGFEDDLPANHPYKNGRPIYDPHWNNVELLLYMDGANASTTFTDYSIYNQTITRAGVTQISTTESQFGGTSMFNGSSSNGNGLRVNDASDGFLIYPGDFTIELWYYQTADTEFNFSSLISRVDTNSRTSAATSSFELGLALQPGGFRATVSVFNTNTATDQQIVGTILTQLNTWNHVAVSRSGDMMYLFVNGQLSQSRTVTGSMIVNTSSASIGASMQNNVDFRHSFRGYIDDVRVTRGVGRYTEAFTPPAAPAPIQISQVALWTPAEIPTALWLDAADASTLNAGSGGSVTTWADKSGNGRDATASTAVARDEGFFPHTSMDFNGAQRFTVPHNAALTAAGGISIFGVARYDATTTNTGWIGKWAASSLDWYHLVGASGHTAGIVSSGSTQVQASHAPATTDAIVWSMIGDPGNLLYNYKNGVVASTVLSAAAGAGTTSVSIGSYSTDAGVDFNGKVGEVIIIDGVANTATRQRIEGYLAHKWGLAANLPVGHPYKASPPTVNWTPADTATSLWLDAADNTTITEVGNVVSSWADKSGNGLNATQGTVGEQPQKINNELNSLSVIRGDGIDDIMTISGPVIAGAGNRTVIGVFKHTGLTNNDALLTLGAGDGISGQAWNFTPEIAVRVTAGNRVFNTAAPLNEYCILASTASDGTTGGINAYLNGGSALGQSSLVAQTLATLGDSTIFGIEGTVSSARAAGDVAEIVVVEGDNLLTRQRIEGYLAWKWGLAGDLSIDHPYKNAAPTNVWTPANMTSMMWLDASDSSTLTLVSGAVSQANDKSGNAYHATQGDAASRPALSAAAIGGLDAMDFDGSNDYLIADAVAPLLRGEDTPFSLFVVGSAAGAFNAFMSLGASSTTGVFCLVSKATGDVLQLQRRVNTGTPGEAQIFDSTTTFGTGPTLLGCVFAGPATSHFINGAAAGSGTCDAPAFTTTISRFTVGALRRSTNGSFLNGLIGEFLLIPGAVDTTTRQRIEGYLAHKWGLAGDLPIDHPYKLAAPTF